MLLTPSSLRPGVHRRLLPTVSLNTRSSSHPIQACKHILPRVYNISLSEASQKALVVSQISHNSVRNAPLKVMLQKNLWEMQLKRSTPYPNCFSYKITSRS